MRTAILAFVLILAVASAESNHPTWVYDAFDHWCNQWDKTYDSPSEKEFRVGVFYSNMQYIEETNAAQDSYKLGPNGFTDLTVEEFLSLHTGLLPIETPELTEEIVEMPGYPASVDWVSAGYVTGVKNQGQCGSCWAFSTTGGLEGLEKKEGKALTSLSEQQLVDCSGSYGNYGCNGGLMDNAFKYVEQYGLEGESTYAYTAKTGSCRYSSSSVVFKNSGYTDVSRQSESAFLTTLSAQPISIAIDAEKIMSYTSGIFNNAACGTSLDHGVLAVGYDTSAGYIKVKNSWGTTWGESGYIRFALEGNGSGECGMYLQASVPK
jgi:Papain family cysteine protease/Cathepsin propeptide inhibitor domain (I29)